MGRSQEAVREQRAYCEKANFGTFLGTGVVLGVELLETVFGDMGVDLCG